MSAFLTPEIARVVLLTAIVGSQVQWQKLVNTTVPEPYLDEVFHVPQAQAYWAGKWDVWDDKITTPPGVYLFSYGINCIRSLFSSEGVQSTTEDLRFSNALLLYVLLVLLYVWTAVRKRQVHYSAVLQREFAIVIFPLFFFFSGLYYTDLFSVVTVLATYVAWSASVQTEGWRKGVCQMLHFALGIAALGTRQTNVFWVAVFLGGSQVVESVKTRVGANEVHDPPVAEAFFEDFLITSISITQHVINNLPTLLVELWPSVALLASFAGFVVWNGGVVLGDKSNHIAAIHVPQLLYFFTFLVFFSWPTLLPFVSNLSVLASRIPRWTTWIIFAILGAATVYGNTVVHPFLLADNRHYTFYIIRLLLLRHWLVRYLAVPIYLLCGWLSICALGGSAQPRRGSVVATSRGLVEPDTVHVSFVLVWLLSTALSLVTAPLVEPRYFIVPWLVWRLHVPEVFPNQPAIQTAIVANESATGIAAKKTKASAQTDQPRVSLRLSYLAQYSPHIEFLWYALINLATCWMFLYRPFQWPQEPGKEQRFMW